MTQEKLMYVFPVFGKNLTLLTQTKSSGSSLVHEVCEHKGIGVADFANNIFGLNSTADDCVLFHATIGGNLIEIWLVWAPLRSMSNPKLVGSSKVSVGEVYSKVDDFGLSELTKSVFMQAYGQLFHTVAYGELKSSITGKTIAP